MSSTISIAYNFTQQVYIRSITQVRDFTNYLSLFECAYGCSAKLIIKVNSISGCNLYVGTHYTNVYPRKPLTFAEIKTGGEYTFTISYNVTDPISASVFMLPTTIDSSIQMNANFTVSMANWGLYLYDPIKDSGVYLQNGHSSQCNNSQGGSQGDSQGSSQGNSQGSSQGDNQGMSIADKVLTAFDAFITVWIFAATTIFIIMFICILKMRKERRGYSSKNNDSRIVTDRDIPDEDENNDAKNPIEEMNANQA